MNTENLLINIYNLSLNIINYYFPFYVYFDFIRSFIIKCKQSIYFDSNSIEINPDNYKEAIEYINDLRDWKNEIAIPSCMLLLCLIGYNSTFIYEMYLHILKFTLMFLSFYLPWILNSRLKKYKQMMKIANEINKTGSNINYSWQNTFIYIIYGDLKLLFESDFDYTELSKKAYETMVLDKKYCHSPIENIIFTPIENILEAEKTILLSYLKFNVWIIDSITSVFHKKY